MRGIPGTGSARLVLLLAVILGAALLQASDGASEPISTYCYTQAVVVHDGPGETPLLPTDPNSVLEAYLILFVLVLVGFIAFKRLDLRFVNLARGPSQDRETPFQAPPSTRLCVLRQ